MPMNDGQNKPKRERRPVDPKEPKPDIKTYGFFKKKRSGVYLTKEQVREIKEQRKKLRSDLKNLGEKERKEFEVTASSMGLYFDKTRFWSTLKWFMVSKGGWIMLASAGVLMLALYGISVVTELRGHFTISMSETMFDEGFTISDSPDFGTPKSHLFSTPKADVPCISIVDIPEDVDDRGNVEHNDSYFSYTFYLKNSGKTIADYNWEIRINSESDGKDVSKAAWVMVFVDGEMYLYAEAKENGEGEAVPSRDVDNMGYVDRPLYDKAKLKEDQYELVKQDGAVSYWRLLPIPFVNEDTIAQGKREQVQPGEVHKYTVVVWLEGDDPDCTVELEGGHIGLEMYMVMVDEDLE